MGAEGDDVADYGMVAVGGDIKPAVLLSLGVAEDDQHFGEPFGLGRANRGNLPGHGGIVAEHLLHESIHRLFRGQPGAEGGDGWRRVFGFGLGLGGGERNQNQNQSAAEQRTTHEFLSRADFLFDNQDRYQPPVLAAMGKRRPEPKALREILSPGAACWRLYSAPSTIRITLRTSIRS